MARTTYRELIDRDVGVARAAIRAGGYSGHTAGLAAGKLQANLAIMPAAHAGDFEAFCRANPKACPLVGKTAPGNPMWSELGDIDLRTDVPSYNLYRHGALTDQVNDLTALWQGDFVAFAIGCSFTFERALMAEGIPMAHIEADRTVPMYRTTLMTHERGPFGGGMVVSLRLIPEDQVEAAREITARYPWAHGAPVHVGDPAEIGITEIGSPDWGDPPIGHGVPMFWGCGVTPQNAIARAKLPLVITHTPGAMLITDIADTADAFLK
ncbi:MAG: putative hydro-lyase [Pseudomonadota bacterium]